jgi:hypothetical protein
LARTFALTLTPESLGEFAGCLTSAPMGQIV